MSGPNTGALATVLFVALVLVLIYHHLPDRIEAWLARGDDYEPGCLRGLASFAVVIGGGVVFIALLGYLAWAVDHL